MNESLIPGGMFAVVGHKVRVAGDNPDCGVYFVSATDHNQKVKVIGHLADNTASRIVGIIPALAPGKWQVRVVTQFASGGTTIKEPRTVTALAALTV